MITKNLCQSIIKIAKEENIKTIVDPKGTDYSKYEGAYLITPNRHEFELASGIYVDKDNLKDAKPFLNKFKVDNIILTLSENGMAIINGSIRHHETLAKEVYDVTGAGDCVISTIAYSLVNGKNIDDSVILANKAASISVSKIGSSIVKEEELK